MSREFNEWKQSRQVTSFEGLPLKFQDQLKEFISKYNPDQVRIYGSYANGDWIDENTPQYYQDLKYKIKYKNKISDLDIIVIPNPGVTNFKDLHIGPIQDTGILIYEKT